MPAGRETVTECVSPALPGWTLGDGDTLGLGAGEGLRLGDGLGLAGLGDVDGLEDGDGLGDGLWLNAEGLGDVLGLSEGSVLGLADGDGDAPEIQQEAMRKGKRLQEGGEFRAKSDSRW